MRQGSDLSVCVCLVIPASLAEVTYKSPPAEQVRVRNLKKSRRSSVEWLLRLDTTLPVRSRRAEIGQMSGRS